MPRKLLIRSDTFPYHVTARCNNKEDFPLPLERVWDIICDELLLITILFEVRIHSFVLMPNHFHLLISTPKEDLGIVMNFFMGELSKLLNRHSGRSGRIFGGPYYWSIITSSRYYGHAFKYIYRNPVKSKLCTEVESYGFSTIKGLLGLDHLRFPLFYTECALELNLPPSEDLDEWLEWLNRPFPQEAEKVIQKLLKRKRIDKILDIRSRKPISILEELL